MSVLPERDPSQRQFAIGGSLKLEDRVSYECEHFLYLPFSAFMNGNSHETISTDPGDN